MNYQRFAFGLITLLLAQRVNAADTKEQQPRASAPVLGYAFGEESRQLRAVLGVPGASSWSDPLAIPDGVTSVRVANGHLWALTFSGVETGVLLLDTLQYTRLESLGTPDGAIFSPAGSAVAIFRGDSVTVFAGLPDAANRIATLAAAPGSVAVSDSGEVALVREGRILRASTGEVLSACIDDCRIAYFPGSDALAVLEAGRLTELRAGESRLIAQGLDAGMQQFSPGASRIVLTTKSPAGNAKLVVIERASGSIAAEETLAGADRIEAMRLPGTWLLSAAEGSAAWLYSNDGVRFVPATRSKEQ